MAEKRRNLGLRATDEMSRQLQSIAESRRTSVQGLFEQVMEGVTSEARARRVEMTPPPSNRAQSDDTWRMLFLKSLPAAAVIKRASDLAVVWVNEGYTAMTTESPGALIGKRVGQIWAARESATLIEEHDREALSRGCATVEIENVRDRWGKSLRRLRIRFPIHGEDGDIEYLGAIGFDYDHIVSRLPSRPGTGDSQDEDELARHRHPETVTNLPTP